MADKKLSSVDVVNDMAFVYAETSDGKTVKISKADLASVAAGLMGLNLKGISHPHPSSAVSFGPICGLVIYRRSYASNEPMLGFVDTNTGYLHLISGRSDIWSDLYIRDGVLMSSGSGTYWGGVSAILIGMTL